MGPYHIDERLLYKISRVIVVGVSGLVTAGRQKVKVTNPNKRQVPKKKSGGRDDIFSVGSSTMDKGVTPLSKPDLSSHSRDAPRAESEKNRPALGERHHINVEMSSVDEIDEILLSDSMSK